MVLVPKEVAVTRPELLTVADGDEEVHVAVAVRSCTLPSEYLPVALNCCVVPKGRIGVCGFTAIETREGEGETVRAAVPLTPEAVAVIVDVPAVRDVMNPASLTSLLTLATVGEDELHSTEDKT